MTLDPDLVRVALTGAAYTAPLGSAAPTNATTAWPTGWVDIGWISDDGVTESYNDDVSEIKAWQNAATVRRVISGGEATLQFTAIETSPATLELYHKGSTVGTGKIPVYEAAPDERMFGLDVIDGDDHIRIFIARGEVTERGDITYKSDSAVGYELTITAYPNASGLVLTKFSDALGWSI
jgi:hypothetical protein